MFTAFVETVSKKLQENLPLITRVMKEQGVSLPGHELGEEELIKPKFIKAYEIIARYLPPPHNLITFIVPEEDFVSYCLTNRAHIFDLLQRDISTLEAVSLEPVLLLSEEQEEENLKWNIQFLRILSFIELSKIDSEISPEEVEYIHKCIENSGFNPETQHELLSHLHSHNKPNIDFGHFQRNTYEGVSLMLDLVALAKCNGKLHVAERIYIKRVGKELGIAEADINELLAG